MRSWQRLRGVLAPTLALGALTLLTIESALAALGEDAASVETDRAKLKGELRSGQVAGYTVHEIHLASGTVVKEYVSSGNRIFAVTWRGPAVPSARDTLGRYFDELQRAATDSAPHPSHHHLSVEHPDLIVQTSGHMRAYFGRAYVPSLLPRNFSISDIQ